MPATCPTMARPRQARSLQANPAHAPDDAHGGYLNQIDRQNLAGRGADALEHRNRLEFLLHEDPDITLQTPTPPSTTTTMPTRLKYSSARENCSAVLSSARSERTRPHELSLAAGG